ncbi:MAG: tetratricopeptide repeat protein [Phenylobacterium sp.]|uniref:O-linked N-acetylglucosamine transferase, SPINDLY family protein n=1 Tax=Phenylobacterium sp. TaxID=1871053 RepID=UPI003568155A
MTETATSAEAYLDQGRALLTAGRLAEAQALAAKALSEHPGSAELWNLQAVLLRQGRRPAEALAAAERALALDPALRKAAANRANLLMDLGRPQEAAEAFGRLAAEEPDNGLFHDGQARALLRAGQVGPARAAMTRALRLTPAGAGAWLQLAALAQRQQGPEAALAVLEEGLGLSPDNSALLEGKATALRQAGRRTAARKLLEDVLARHPDWAWPHFHLGDLLADEDRPAGLRHLRRALELQPNSVEHRLALVQALARAVGPDEGTCLDEAAELCAQIPPGAPLRPAQLKILRDVHARTCAFDAGDRLGDFKTLGRAFAAAGLHTAFLWQLARVRTAEDRRELVEQHRLWGEGAESRAARQPIARPARARGDRIRLGVVSADLRRHPVGYFAEPVFAHLQPDRFELFAYAFDRPRGDPMEAWFAERATFRRAPEASDREAAQIIADDGLDVLIELGGSTAGNRLEALAYAPAPRQASWLGYPHSSGLSAIEGFVCDALNAPTEPGLLLETPLTMPKSWIAMGASAFQGAPAIDARTPQERRGALTFGTANSPNKYTREVLRAWAGIVAQVPGARFAFVRPEAASQAFRARVSAEFAAAGVDAERIEFHPVRGAHLPWYETIDISLDTFPLTGGTTTVESLWMGVPVVSLSGAAFFERQGRSILTNAGLADLVAEDLEGYRRIALELAVDHDRRRRLRTGLRDQILAGPLGDTEGFAADFYDLIARWVG